MLTSMVLTDEELRKIQMLASAGIVRIVPTTNPYELLRIRDGNIVITAYKSGKIVYEENEETLSIIDQILEKETGEFDYILGSDEAGKGEWYGPLVVASIALKPEDITELRKLGVRDSKTIGKGRLRKIAQGILNRGYEIKCVILRPETYNQKYQEFKRENKTLNDLLAWMHSRAIKDILDALKPKKAKIIIDEFDFKKMDKMLSDLDTRDRDIVKVQLSRGESEIPVAAASILAKFTFEREVDQLNEKYHVNLRETAPSELDPNILTHVAKIHFKNVEKHAKLT